MISFAEEFSKLKKIYNNSANKQKLETAVAFLSHKPVVLYGAGEIGNAVYSALKQYGVGDICFCDKNKFGTHQSGVPIITPNALMNVYSEANIIICSVNYANAIKQELSMLGVDSKRIFEREDLYLSEMTLKDMEPYLEGYGRAFELLGDDKSREVLMNRLSGCLFSSPMAHELPSCQYFDPEIITLGDEEILVDGGMYIGDTAEQFIKFVKGKYKHYYGFEPDLENSGKARKSLEGMHNITIVDKGLWHDETQLSFCGNFESSSKLDNNGDCLVEVTSLDIYFKDRTPPTFIKMDVEGAELEALKGSRHLIIENKPKLAICAYHKPEDVYTLLELIKSYRNDYRFLLRHYSDSIYETVLYAI